MSAISTTSEDFWPPSGQVPLQRTHRGCLQPSADWLRHFLTLPELMLVAESCAAERVLHAALLDCPECAVQPRDLAALQDEDARSNYAAFLDFRDGLKAAGTLEAWYLGQIRAAPVSVAPTFLNEVVHAVLRGLPGSGEDAFEARAAELLFRRQRITSNQGRLLAADLAAIDMLSETAAVEMTVLTRDNAHDYWARAARREWLLDLTHEVDKDIGHGLVFTLQLAHAGLAALARVLEKWVLHFLGTVVKITPLQRIDDAAWRWHIGLDVHSMALLNDLYEDRPVDAGRQARLISLFRLDFENAGDMRANVAGYPVYLGLASAEDGTLKLKPQNLLLNLPLARES